MLASEVLGHAAKVYLNDSAQALWTNAVLLPPLQEAALRLEALLRDNGIDYIMKKTSDSPIAISAGDTELASYPTDFIEPIWIRERPLDSDEDWSDKLQEVEEIDPNLSDSDSIIQWSFSEGKIFINPPTTDREILLSYNGRMTTITDVSSTVVIQEAKSFLAAKTAELAARHIGNNPTKADLIQMDAEREGTTLVNVMLKNDQGAGGVRRKGYRSR